MNKNIVILFCLVAIINTGKAQVSDTTLQGFCPYKFGASINVSLLKTVSGYRALVAREYNSVTPENAMKFAVIHPLQDSFYWADGDTLVSFAEQYGKRVHGHTLIWYNDIPNWVTNFVGDSAAWENIFKTHIQTVVGHYKGKCTSWDVVNEAVNDSGGILRNTIWLQNLGPNYIARAFQYAHEADSAALLFYNDYGQETNTVKFNAIKALVDTLLAKGVPINGVGFQMHQSDQTSNNNIIAVLDSMVLRNVLIHISELDVAMNPEDNLKKTYTPAVADLEFGKYKFMARFVKTIPSSKFYGITTWDVTDRDSWIPPTYMRPDWPLPFDSFYQKKLCYQGIKDGATNTWDRDSSSCESLSGTYTDLGTNGTAITTDYSGNAMTYNNDNSSVQNIGFTFNFNGSSYTQFVLNTNGYIKLGAAASTANFYYTTSAGAYGSTITASDIDIIYPYNHLLTSGTGTPEYRVYTTGAVGSHVCTIQFKNVADGFAQPQYANINFQIKLYETTNQIDFVYGTWTPSANASASVTAAVGIRGISSTESVNVAKASSVAWTNSLSLNNTFYFKNGNYPANGPEFNSRNTFLPDAGRTFRFAASSTLPLSLLSFNAKETGNTIALQWATANEINCKEFEVQRSLDGQHFSTIATVDAKGNNGLSNNQYNAIDNNIATLNVVYYRLKEDAADGSYTYSAIIKINLNSNISFKVITAPNPFTNNINVQIESATSQNIRISLLDLNGKVLFTKQQAVVQGASSIPFDASSIAHGIYFLRLNTSMEETTVKLVK
jgi:endo-1,4-beta-xylanase